MSDTETTPADEQAGDETDSFLEISHAKYGTAYCEFDAYSSPPLNLRDAGWYAVARRTDRTGLGAAIQTNPTSADDGDSAPSSSPDEVPTGSISDVLAWVDGDPARAEAALTTEIANQNRVTLINDLRNVIDS